MSFVLLPFLFLTIVAGPASTTRHLDPFSVPNWRPSVDYSKDKIYPLPLTVIPKNYVLRIRPILIDDLKENFTAPGFIQITLQCREVTREVTFHKDSSLVIHESSILLFELNENGEIGAQIQVMGTSFDERSTFYTFHLIQELQVGRSYQLSMEFLAQVNDGNLGLYRAIYETPEGDQRIMATTQFQSYPVKSPSGARKAFPCFDEPGLKATFEITIGRKIDQNSMSNASPKEIGISDPQLPLNWVWDIYNRTVPMSTYLVAFIVSDFTCVQADSTIFDGRSIRVCGPPLLIDEYNGGWWSANVSAFAMKFLEETLKFPYEMYKVDNVALPRAYYAPGGMENYGLATYGDHRLLHYEGMTSQAEEYDIWGMIFHELGHFWFGDLVTCATWDHIFVNEAFATYITYTLNQLAPEFDTEREIIFRTQRALAYDVGVNEPVYNEEGNSDYSIIYEKGASLIRMMEGIMAKPVLFEAIVEYLRIFAYKPVTKDELFEIFNKFAQGRIPEGVTVQQILDTWTLQPGYPLLRVSKVDPGQIHISQETFLDVGQENGNLWEIPIAIVTNKNPNFGNYTPALWLNQTEIQFEVDLDTTWIFVNPDTMTFARVIYDDYLLGQIHNLLAESLDNLSGLSRAQLIDDYFNFAKHGHVTLDKALELTNYLDKENDQIVWHTALKYMAEIDLTKEELKDYLLPKLESFLDRALPNWTLTLGSIGLGSWVMTTSEIFDWACFLESVNCRRLALKLFEEWMEQPEQLSQLIPPDFQNTIFCYGVAQLGIEAHNFLREEYEKADKYRPLKARFESALSCASS